MAAKQVDAKARDNLQPWLTSLRTPGLSKEGMLKIYSDWTEKATYDSDLIAGGYEAPVLTVRYFSESFPKENRDKIKILDIGAGTGLVARGLRSEGFCHIDALDASDAMLSIAKKDGLYENYFCEFISGTPLTCFKPGGIVVIVARAAFMGTSSEFKDRLLPLIDTLEKQGKWKKLLAETTGQYFLNDEAIIWKFRVL